MYITKQSIPYTIHIVLIHSFVYKYNVYTYLCIHVIKKGLIPTRMGLNTEGVIAEKFKTESLFFNSNK